MNIKQKEMLEKYQFAVDYADYERTLNNLLYGNTENLSIVELVSGDIEHTIDVMQDSLASNKIY